MPGRSFNTGYRYGFNGKENDPESGTQDYGMRIYNPSLGKFLSVDPLTDDYPWYTPYQFAGNSPIEAIDLDGLEKSSTSNSQKGDDGGVPTNKSAQELYDEADPVTRFFVMLTYGLHKYGEMLNEVKGVSEKKKPTENAMDALVDIQDKALLVQGTLEMMKGGQRGASKVEPLFAKQKGTHTARLAIYYASVLMESLPKKYWPRSVTAIVDSKTGRVYLGRSGGLKMAEIGEKLKGLLPKSSKEIWPVEQCSECDALNSALNDGAEAKNLKMYTLQLEKKSSSVKPMELCKNCETTTKDVKTVETTPKKK